MKDDLPVELYERDGVTYYFFSNGNYEVAAWKTDDWTECRISGPVTREELKSAVESMSP